MPHFKQLQKDKKLSVVLKKSEKITLQPQKHIYLKLCAAIMSQQLSTRVADVIYKRFLVLCGKNNPSIADILKQDIETLRGIGLSYNKARYVLNVCDFFRDKKLTDCKLSMLPDDELVALLTQIKGVGRWTVEMILMSGLGREDVFAVDDLGIQQGMIKLYNIEATNKKILGEKMTAIAENWRPYRTYACRYIWAWKDGK